MCAKRTLSRMVHFSIVGCKNNQKINSEVTYFSLPKDPQRRKSLAANSRDESNLPFNFQNKYFGKLWDLQNRFFCTHRPIKRKLTSRATQLLPHTQIPRPRKTSKIRAKKKKEEVRL